MREVFETWASHNKVRSGKACNVYTRYAEVVLFVEVLKEGAIAGWRSMWFS